MNKLSTTALILIAIAIVYIFRDKLRNLIAPMVVINAPAPQKTNCDCPQTQPNAPVANNPESTEEAQGNYIDEDLEEVLQPTGSNYGAGAVPYSLNANTIY